MSTNTKNSIENSTNPEIIPKATSDITFNEGSMISMTRGDKFSTDVKRSFAIEDATTGYKVNLKWDTMLEMAEQDSMQDINTLLLRNGWESDGKMSAGAGIAVKVEKIEDFYNFTFFESEMGKAFDKDKIQRKTYIKLNREHLSSIFTFLRYDEKAVKAKAAALKIQRTTLDLG